MKKSFFTLALSVIIGSAVAQNSEPIVLPPPPSAEEIAMMKAYESYATPGEEHTKMANDVGDWLENITIWSAPGAPPMKSTSKMAVTMVLEGRYQQAMHNGTFNNMPFKGLSTLAYDNAKKKYISTWIDNMGTGIMVMEGKPNASGKMMEMKGTQVDPVTGKDMEVREEIYFTDKNTQKMKMFMTPVNGKEFQSMEILMTRMGKE